MELRCDLCNISFTTVPIAKNFPCGHNFCHKCDSGDELQRCYTCQQNLKIGCGVPDPHTHSSSLQHSPAPPYNTPQLLTSPETKLRPYTPKLNTNASTAARRTHNSDAIYQTVLNRQPPEFEGGKAEHCCNFKSIREMFEQLSQKSPNTATHRKGKEGEEGSKTAHGPCLPSTRQEETHSWRRDSPDPLRNIRSSPSRSEAHHPTVHKRPHSRGNQPYPHHVRTKDLYLTPPRPREPSPSPSRPREPSPSPSRTKESSSSLSRPREPSPSPSRPREPSPSPSRPKEPSPSLSRPREPSPSPSRPREPSPAPSRTREPSPSPSRPREPSPSSSRTREHFPFNDHYLSPSRTQSVSSPPPRARTHSPSHCISRHISRTCSGQQGQGVGGEGHHTGSQQPLIKPPLGTGTRRHSPSSTPGRLGQGVAVDGIASVHQHQQKDSASHSLPHTPSVSLMPAQEERPKVREHCENLEVWSERLQEELKKLRDEKGRLQEEVMQLKEKEGNMQQLGEEKKGRMQEELRLGEEKESRMQEELTQLRQKYKHQEEEIVHLREENRHLQQKTVDEEDLAKQALTSALKEIASLTVEVGALKQKNIKQEEELGLVKQDKDRQEEEKAWLRKVSSKQQREIALLEARGKVLQAELAHLREYYSSKQQEVMIVPQEQANMQELVTTLEQKNAQQEEEMTSLKEDKARQEEEVTCLKEDKARQEEEVTSLKEDKARQEEEVTSLKDDKARQEKEVVYLREECARLQQQVAEEKDKNVRTKKQVTLLLDNYNKWQEKMEQMKTKEMHNRHGMEQSKKINNNLEEELQLMKEDKARQEVMVTSLKEDKARLEEVVTRLKKENEHQREEKAKYEEEVNHFRISEQEEMAAWWKEEKQRHQLKEAMQEEEIAHLKGKDVQNQEEMAQLIMERENCQEEIDKLKRKKDTLREEITEVRRVRDECQVEIQTLRENGTVQQELMKDFVKNMESSQEAMLEEATAQLRNEIHSYKEEIHHFRENETRHEKVTEEFIKKIESSQEEIDGLKRKEMEAREELKKLKNAAAKQKEKIRQVEEERDKYLEELEKQAITQRKDNAVFGVHSACTRLPRVEAGKEVVMVTHGLPNLGNSCYINSVVQCLYHLPPLRACLNEYAGHLQQGVEHHEVAIALRQLFVTMKTGKGIHHAARSLKGVLGSRDEAFQGSKQQEAHDLLSFLLLWLDDDLSKGNKPSPISLFQGQMKSTMTCDQQGRIITNTTETFTSLSLPVVKQGMWTLENLLSRHFESQTLEWDCKHCSSTHNCTHSTHLLDCPPVLIIHLNRYHENSYSAWKERVKIPFEGLSLQPHMAPNLTSPRYKLASVVCHQGTQRSGHYLAYCRSGGRRKGSCWNLCNDEWVTGVGKKEMNHLDGAHLLFYLKQEE